MNIFTLSSDCIQSVCTRFFYEGEKLCYRIELAYLDSEKLVLFEEYNNYEDYKLSHDKLVTEIQNQDQLSCSFNRLELVRA